MEAEQSFLFSAESVNFFFGDKIKFDLSYLEYGVAKRTTCTLSVKAVGWNGTLKIKGWYHDNSPIGRGSSSMSASRSDAWHNELSLRLPSKNFTLQLAPTDYDAEAAREKQYNYSVRVKVGELAKEVVQIKVRHRKKRKGQTVDGVVTAGASSSAFFRSDTLSAPCSCQAYEWPLPYAVSTPSSWPAFDWLPDNAETEPSFPQPQSYSSTQPPLFSTVEEKLAQTHFASPSCERAPVTIPASVVPNAPELEQEAQEGEERIDDLGRHLDLLLLASRRERLLSDVFSLALESIPIMSIDGGDNQKRYRSMRLDTNARLRILQVPAHLHFPKNPPADRDQANQLILQVEQWLSNHRGRFSVAIYWVGIWLSYRRSLKQTTTRYDKET